jgi:hypothetical protein
MQVDIMPIDSVFFVVCAAGFVLGMIAGIYTILMTARELQES